MSMTNEMKAVLVAGGAGIFMGMMLTSVAFVSGSTPSDRTNEPNPTETVTVEKIVTETKIVEKPVEKVVKVVELPESCLDAITNAKQIRDNTSTVAGSMGAQLDIASKARVAMTGSDYLDLGEVQRDQRNLEQDMRDAYTQLASAQSLLADNLEQCEIDTDS